MAPLAGGSGPATHYQRGNTSDAMHDSTSNVQNLSAKGTAVKRRAQRVRQSARQVGWLINLVQAKQSHHTGPGAGHRAMHSCLPLCQGCVSLLARVAALESRMEAPPSEVPPAAADEQRPGGASPPEVEIHSAEQQLLGSAALGAEASAASCLAGSAARRMEVDVQQELRTAAGNAEAVAYFAKSATKCTKVDEVDQNTNDYDKAQAKEFRPMVGSGSAPSIAELKERYSAMVADEDSESDTHEDLHEVTDDTTEQARRLLEASRYSRQFKEQAWRLLAPHIAPAPRPRHWGRHGSGRSSSSWSWHEWV